MIDYLIILSPFVLVAFIARWRDLRRIGMLEVRANRTGERLDDLYEWVAEQDIGLQEESEMRKTRLSYLYDRFDHLSDDLRRLEGGKP